MSHSFRDRTASTSCIRLFGYATQADALQTIPFTDLVKSCFLNPYLPIPKVLEILNSPPPVAEIQTIIQKCQEQIKVGRSPIYFARGLLKLRPDGVDTCKQMEDGTYRYNNVKIDRR